VMDFALQIHKVDTLVSYKNDEWDDEEWSSRQHQEPFSWREGCMKYTLARGVKAVWIVHSRLGAYCTSLPLLLHLWEACNSEIEIPV
jgi:hypothetical protein